MHKIVDNFLSEEDFSNIKSIMTQNFFPWYTVCDYGVSEQNSDDDMYFTHNFYSNYSFNSEFSKIILPILEKVSPKSLIRIKGNLYPGTKNFIYHNYHTDYNFDHKAFIFYINSNNGKTILYDDKKPIEIDSIENRILFFNPQILHRSTNCTDEKYRVNINCNYF